MTTTFLDVLMAVAFWSSTGAFALYGALIGGTLAGGTSLLVSRSSIRAQKDLAKARQDHEREEAREARIQVRFENTYVPLFEYLTGTEEVVRRRSRAFIQVPPRSGEPAPPDDAIEGSRLVDLTLPDAERLMHLSALVQAYGTDAVRDGMREVQMAMIRFDLAAGTLDDVRMAGPGPDGRPPDVRDQRDELNRAKEAFEAVSEKVRTDALNDLRRWQNWDNPA